MIQTTIDMQAVRRNFDRLAYGRQAVHEVSGALPEIRKYLGLSRADVADRLGAGWSTSVLAKVEGGDRVFDPATAITVLGWVIEHEDGVEGELDEVTTGTTLTGGDPEMAKDLFGVPPEGEVLKE